MPPLIRAHWKYEMPWPRLTQLPHYGSACCSLHRWLTDLPPPVVGCAYESRANHTEHPTRGHATASAVAFDYDTEGRDLFDRSTPSYSVTKNRACKPECTVKLTLQIAHQPDNGVTTGPSLNVNTHPT
jgi:hypothetical protein